MNGIRRRLSDIGKDLSLQGDNFQFASHGATAHRQALDWQCSNLGQTEHSPKFRV